MVEEKRASAHKSIAGMSDEEFKEFLEKLMDRGLTDKQIDDIIDVACGLKVKKDKK